MIDRQLKILDFLHGQNRWIYGRELAGIFGVSSRTIRSDVASINYGHEPPRILTDQKKGYRYNLSKAWETALPASFSFHERLMYEAKHLLVDGWFDYFDMAETLSVSETTIDTDMAKFREFLVEYAFEQIQLSKRKTHYVLTGTEHYKNNILYELGRYLYKDFSMDIFARLFPEFEAVRRIVEDSTAAAFQETRYLKTAELCVDFALLIEKARLNSDFGPQAEELPAAGELVHHIARDIEARFGWALPPAALAQVQQKIQITQELAAFENRVHHEFASYQNLQKLYASIAEDLKEIYHIDVQTCEDLYRDMIMHIRMNIQRIRAGYKYYNPLKDQLLERYPFVIDIVLYLARKVQSIFDVQLDSNDLSFLVAYMGGILHHIYQHNLRDIDFGILLISFESRSHLIHVSQYIRESLAQQKHFIVTVNSYLEYSMLSELPHTYDFTVYMGEPSAAIAADLYLSGTFSARDKHLLSDHLRQRIAHARHEKFEGIFQQYFDPALFLHKKNAESKEQLIADLAKLLARKGLVGNGFVDSVLARENIIPTSLDIQVALPHALSYDARETKMAIAVLDEPMRWDPYRVRVVLLLASALKDEDQLHLFVDFLSDSLSLEDSREKIRQVESFEDIHRFFRDRFML